MKKFKNSTKDPSEIFKILKEKYPEIEIDALQEEEDKNELLENDNFTIIGFLGRENEMGEIQKFLKTPTKRILEISGVPMIGKSFLTREFCEKNNIKNKRISIRTKPYTPAQDIQEQLFGENRWNDFSQIDEDTLIIIENFEHALEWTPKSDHLHEINAAKIHNFLNGILQAGNKLILESRFQTRFDSGQRFFVQQETITAIPTDLFWDFYKEKQFSHQEFNTICEKFNAHTGLLALAYNDVEWLYDKELRKALYEPTSTTQKLWELLEIIIKRLQKAEKQLLAALTLLQKPIHKDTLATYLQGYFKGNMNDTLMSLRKKLLATSTIQAEYSLNPYLAEVCYTFFSKSVEVGEIKKLPAFKEVALPEYDRIYQAHLKGDFKTFFEWVKDTRAKGKYNEVIEMLQKAFFNDPQPVIILNEIAITYKWQNNYVQAKNILNQALNIEPQNVKVLNELAVIYKKEENFEEAKNVLNKALEINAKNLPSLNELAIIYKQEKNFEEAKNVLNKALEINAKNLPSLNELAIIYKQEKNFEEAKNVLNKALEINPKDVKTLNELAIIYKEEGNFTEAKNVLNKALEIEPKNVKVLNELAIIYKEEKNFTEAKNILKKACDLGNIHSYNELALVYKEEGNNTEAQKRFLELINQHNHKPAYDCLAKIYVEEGNYTEAKKILDKGLQLFPKDGFLTKTLKVLKKHEQNPTKYQIKGNHRTSIAEKLRTFVSDGKIEDALDTFLKANDLDKQLRTNLILIKSNYNRNKNDNNAGILKKEDYDIAQNKIARALLTYIDEY